MADKPTKSDWEKLAKKESKGRHLSRESVEIIRLATVYGPDDAAAIDSGYPGLPPYIVPIETWLAAIIPEYRQNAAL